MMKWTTSTLKALMLVALLSGCAQATAEVRSRPNGDRLEGNFVDGLLVGPGSLLYADGTRYEGDFASGRLHGRGVMTWTSGARYEGQFTNDARTGQGVYRWPGGISHEGAFVDGKRTGAGVLSWPSGSRLQGVFEDGQLDGPGKHFFANGDIYEGNHVRTARAGRGVLSYANGNRYEGDFLDGMQHGKGVHVSSSGDRYEGDYVQGARTGSGVATWKSGGRYEGGFLNGTLSGKGTYFFADGAQYQGDFVNGKFSGRGKRTWANGARHEGEFAAGRPIGLGTLVSANGTRYEGEFANGQINGKGVQTQPDGARYEGEFFVGVHSGEGKLRSANGDRYEGGFLNGALSGPAVLVRANGETLDGDWSQGRFVGHRTLLGKATATGGLQSVSYSAPTGDRLLVAATYAGKPVHLLREGARGTGRWTAWLDQRPSERVRLSFDDQKGLTGALALDTGERIAINRVRQERLEYRLYDAGRRFVAGAVLYRNGAGWSMGRMRTELFWGYGDLTDIEDLSPQLSAGGPGSAVTLAGLIDRWWSRVDIIPSAQAQGLLEGYFSQTAQEARERWAAPLHEMFKASLVGATAFTVKLAAQTLVGGEAVTVGAGIAAAGPFLVAVGTGVVIGVAADNFHQWANARNLGDNAPLRAMFARLMGETKYSLQPDPLPPAGQSAPEGSAAPRTVVAGPDRSEFRASIAKGESCAKARDFACAEAALASARQLALTHQERRELIAKWQLLDGEARLVDLERARQDEQALQTLMASAQRSAADRESALRTAAATAATAATVPAAPAAAATATVNAAPAPAQRPVDGCLQALLGRWSHGVGGTWTFEPDASATLVVNSTNQGGAARQTTVLAISSCEGGTLRYRIVRAAVSSPGFSYDKTEANDRPATVNWSKVHAQPYSLSGGSLQLGNFTYTR